MTRSFHGAGWVRSDGLAVTGVARDDGERHSDGAISDDRCGPQRWRGPRWRVRSVITGVARSDGAARGYPWCVSIPSDLPRARDAHCEFVGDLRSASETRVARDNSFGLLLQAAASYRFRATYPRVRGDALRVCRRYQQRD